MATSAPNTSCNKKTTVIRVGNYELHKTLGKGNFAIVKLASNIITNSKVSTYVILSCVCVRIKRSVIIKK